MSRFDASFQHELASQSWTLYGIGMFVILLRTFARWRRAGSICLLAVDDYLMMTLVPAFYTTLVVCLNVIAGGGGSNLYPPEDFPKFTAEEIQERIAGSKIVVISEQAMLNLIWTLKACMLYLYSRITTTTSYHSYLKFLSIYIFLGWVAIQIVFFSACRPFKGYWGMPPPNPQCTTFEHYAIVQAVFNLSSDVVMLVLPMPILARTSLPWRQKVVLGGLFGMGVFVIIAAILTKTHNLSDVYSTVYMLWYTREASVAVYVANLPGIWPLLREHIAFLRSHVSSYPGNSSRTPLPRYGNGSSHISGVSDVVSRSRRRSGRSGLGAGIGRAQGGTSGKREDEIVFELGSPGFAKEGCGSASEGRSVTGTTGSGSEEGARGAFGKRLEQIGISMRKSLDSDERVLREAGMGSLGNRGSGSGWGHDMEVHVDTTIEVRRGSWDEVAAEKGEDRFEWEVQTLRAPKVKIEGPEGEIVDKP